MFCTRRVLAQAIGEMSMANRNDKHRSNSNTKNRPYCLVGADRLSAAIWKHGDEEGGFHYQFNVFRMLAAHGRVSQLFGPEDVLCLAKLAHILALALIDDGCLDVELKRSLKRLVVRLDASLVNDANPDDRIELVPVGFEILSAIQSVVNYHSYIEQDGYEDALDVTYLMARVEEVQAWLRGLGYESTEVPSPNRKSSQ